jgi:bacillithiol biosynthesis deacetylase BshB1
MSDGHAFDAMCIGAHPDDVEIGMGATVAKMVRGGKRVAIVDLTNGEPTPHGTPEIRAAESAEAARILGVTRRTLSQSNRYLLDTIEARTELAEVIRELRPRLLFVPYPHDSHPDHVAAAAIATAARFYAKFTKTEMSGEPFYPQRVYRYMAVHQRIVAEPSFIVDVEEDLPTKMAALSAYRSQFSANPGNAGIIDLMTQMAAMWGALGRVGAGEPFFALEPVAVRSVDDLI